MPTTALAPFKAALVALLKDAQGLEGVAVTGGKEPERVSEYVWILKTKAGPREFRTLGPRPSLVDEELRATVRVLAIAGDVDDAEARAMELAEAVETAVRGAELEKEIDELLMPLLVEQIEPEQLRFDRKLGFHVLMTICCAKARV